MSKLYGFLEAFSDQGSEGIHWSLSNPYLPGYDSLFTLEDDDELVVYNNNKTVSFSCIVKLDRQINGYEYGQQISGNSVHGIQSGIDPNSWLDMFIAKKRAMLVKKNKKHCIHPFLVEPSRLHKTISTLQFESGLQLFRSAIYPWLSFDSNERHYSKAEELGFEYEEILKLLQGPTEADIIRHKTWPQSAINTIISPSTDMLYRLAVLFGIYGDLKFVFNTVNERKEFLEHTFLDSVRIKDHMYSYNIHSVEKVREITNEFFEEEVIW